MKRLIVILLLVIGVSLSGCKKDDGTKDELISHLVNHNYSGFLNKWADVVQDDRDKMKDEIVDGLVVNFIKYYQDQDVDTLVKLLPVKDLVIGTSEASWQAGLLQTAENIGLSLAGELADACAISNADKFFELRDKLYNAVDGNYRRFLNSGNNAEWRQVTNVLNQIYDNYLYDEEYFEDCELPESVQDRYAKYYRVPKYWQDYLHDFYRAVYFKSAAQFNNTAFHAMMDKLELLNLEVDRYFTNDEEKVELIETALNEYNNLYNNNEAKIKELESDWANRK